MSISNSASINPFVPFVAHSNMVRIYKILYMVYSMSISNSASMVNISFSTVPNLHISMVNISIYRYI